MSKKAQNKHEFIKTLIIALLLAGLVRSFLFEPFHIPSSSMKPNLLIGDYLFVAKYSYGYSRYSFPFSFDLFEGRFWQKNKPSRGDIVVFRLPSDPGINYIKRVIGLPGDRIQMRGGTLYINGEEVKKLVEKLFGSWVKATAPRLTYSNPTNVQYSQINFVDMPNAVQSEVAAINMSNLKMTDPDYFAVIVANQILGGDFNSYINMNLREAHGWTYGARSAIGGDKYISNFEASTQVRNAVTDSTVVEMMKEIDDEDYEAFGRVFFGDPEIGDGA